MSPAQLLDLWHGWQWRRSRDMEVLAVAVLWIRSMLDGEVDFDKVLATFPGYDDERSRQTGWSIYK